MKDAVSIKSYFFLTKFLSIQPFIVVIKKFNNAKTKFRMF